MHDVVCTEIAEIIGHARFTDPSYRWRSVVGNGLNFVAEENAYIPDLTILDAGVLQEAVKLGQMRLITDQASAAYLHEDTWSLGETITLPDPIGIEIPTDGWKPWE